MLDPGAVSGSEDVGLFATAAGSPCVYWLLGGADPALFEGLTTVRQFVEKVASLPSNHSPRFARVPPAHSGRGAFSPGGCGPSLAACRLRSGPVGPVAGMVVAVVAGPVLA